MRQALPHANTVKFLVILRDPIDRALSGYWQASPKTMTIGKASELALAEVDLLRQVYNSTLSLEKLEIKDGRLVNKRVACVSGLEQYTRLNDVLVNKLHVNHPWYRRYIETALNTSLDHTQGHSRAYEVSVCWALQDVPMRHLTAVIGSRCQGYLRGSTSQLLVCRCVACVTHVTLVTWLLAGFQPSQFLVVTTGELHADKYSVLARVAAFLKRSNSSYSRQVDDVVHHKTRFHDPFPRDIVAKLQDYYRPYNKALVKLLVEAGFNVNVPGLLKEFEAH
jgi:hypothetical protein